MLISLSCPIGGVPNSCIKMVHALHEILVDRNLSTIANNSPVHIAVPVLHRPHLLGIRVVTLFLGKGIKQMGFIGYIGNTY